MKLSSFIKGYFALIALLAMFCFALGVVGCGKSADDPESSDQAELSAEEEDDELAEDEEDFDDMAQNDEEGNQQFQGDQIGDQEGDSFGGQGDEQLAADDPAQTDELFADEGAPASGSEDFAAAGGGAGTTVYIVNRGDTLLKISFKVFRSYYKWRELVKYNPDIQDPNIIEIGQKIYYPNEYQQRVVAAVEDEYRIQWGDSLGTISMKFYGTPDRWREIASLNPLKIPNPNEIFAGTTIRVSISGVEQVSAGYEDETTEEMMPMEEEVASEEEILEAEPMEEEGAEEEIEEQQEDA